MNQLFGVVEHVRKHTLTYGTRKGVVVPESEGIVFASDDRQQAEEERSRRQVYANEHGGGGLLIHEAGWKRLGNSSYRIEPITAEPTPQ